MKIIIEAGQHQWYARAEDAPYPYRGLLVAGPSLEFVLGEISGACEDLQEAAAELEPLPSSLTAGPRT